MFILDVTRHHDQKDDYLSQLSDCSLARHSRNIAFRVSNIGAVVDFTAALRRRNDRV